MQQESIRLYYLHLLLGYYYLDIIIMAKTKGFWKPKHLIF